MSQSQGITAEQRRALIERLIRFTRSRTPAWAATMHAPVPAHPPRVDRTGLPSEAMRRELALLERLTQRIVDERA